MSNPAHIAKGRFGEDYACRYLENKGYTIIQRNARIGRAEIDIVAGNRDLIVFVEVKTRSDARFGFPEEAVTEAKMARLQRAAEAWLVENDRTESYARFDVIALMFANGQVLDLRHFENAF